MRPAVASGEFTGVAVSPIALGPSSGSSTALMRSIAVRYSKASEVLADLMDTSIEACRICEFCSARRVLAEVLVEADELASSACAAFFTGWTVRAVSNAAGAAGRGNPMEGVTMLISGSCCKWNVYLNHRQIWLKVESSRRKQAFSGFRKWFRCRGDSAADGSNSSKMIAISARN